MWRNKKMLNTDWVKSMTFDLTARLEEKQSVGSLFWPTARGFSSFFSFSRLLLCFTRHVSVSHKALKENSPGQTLTVCIVTPSSPCNSTSFLPPGVFLHFAAAVDTMWPQWTDVFGTTPSLCSSLKKNIKHKKPNCDCELLNGSEPESSTSSCFHPFTISFFCFLV